MPVQTNIQTINGAKAIIETLKKNSVDTIFGYPGGIVLDLYDELYKQSDIKHILVRHEQYALHAAEGYARQTGKCGVVLVTSGPGATNTVSGIANAYLDGYPLVVLTGQVQQNLLGKNAFQEADICEITRTCSKAVFQIINASEVDNILTKAFKIANEGKKGPVVVDLPKDIFTQSTEFDFNLMAKEDNEQPLGQYSDGDIFALLKRLFDSKQPVIVAGGGVHHSKAYAALEKFADFYGIPVVSSMMGKGAYNTESENYLGMVGIFGDNSANEVVRQSDLIISLGCRYNDRITCKFNDINIFSKMININIVNEPNAAYFINGDICEVLERINNLSKPEDHLKYIAWSKFAKGCKSLNKQSSKISNMMHGFEILQKINKYTEDKNVIFTSDVGQHQVLAVKNLTLTPNRRIFVSGGSGTMGFGLPAAIGAAIANPDACVVCITGDGSIQMSLSELALCKDLGLNIKVIILDNGYLGMVRQLQENNCAGRYSQTKLSSPDFVKLGQSYGIDAKRINSPDEVNDALDCAFSKNNTFILDFVIESLEIV